MELKHLPLAFDLKAADRAGRSFSGHASANALDLGGDAIVPGSWGPFLKSWNRGKAFTIPLLDSHSRDSVFRVLGKLADAREDDVGLLTKFALVPGPDGERLLDRLQGGFLTGLSIGYVVRPGGARAPTDAERRQGVERVLTAIDLREVSVVVEPMNPAARIATDSVTKVHGLQPDDPRRLAGEALIAEFEARVGREEQQRAAQLAALEAHGALGVEDPHRLALEDRYRALLLDPLLRAARRN